MKNYTFKAKYKMTPAQIIVSYYFIAIAISVILLRLPGVHRPGVKVDFIDSLFTAVSAVSVTGLTTISIVDTYTIFGYIMLILILQLGGIGIMSLGTFIWLVVGRRIGLRERQLIMVDHNQSKMSGAVMLIKEIIKILLFIQLLGSIILTVYFTQYYDTFKQALLHGVFTSVSATTNAGFDITGESLVPYHHDYFVLIITSIMIVFGAIGFPVLIEVKEFLSNKNKNFRFSLFTKLTTLTYGALLIIGTVMIFLLELFNTLKDLPWHEKFFTAFFHSVSTRSAGLTTVDINMFNEGTNLFMSALMFIGASPSSVGGGIRTTTFALAILFLINFSRGKENIQIFNREIHLLDIYRAFAVFVLAILMVFAATIILSVSEPGVPVASLLFEITSAFGTCGMSLGVTENLSSFGKLVIMLLMFIGRVGLISFLFTLGGKRKITKYHYPKERVIIG
ncbi:MULTISPECIES: TrkH family potassium uptake protein [unclassified Psychrobacillus]|uniref:TrkH family potassium uptake protein n=1 Tax=unclassified Psychrobacillus TaxID=2636677 RepID=UPI00146D1193|nr:MULTISPECIES: TrkH family potassium uptake protein [unclassified Psychrobacillus]MCM3358973.1 TrkH family potassium uptake protein [Psychrobacillus sp. MER TA 171]NME05132.1 TrkH family potassium uptake protein [Psychrobacillus sp. BL-248-WT-3]